MPDLEKQKQEFLTLCRENIKRDGLEDLLGWLQKSDFFTAPASTRYHGAYEGGLCEHSLDVYHKDFHFFVGEYGNQIFCRLGQVTLGQNMRSEVHRPDNDPQRYDRFAKTSCSTDLRDRAPIWSSGTLFSYCRHIVIGSGRCAHPHKRKHES